MPPGYAFVLQCAWLHQNCCFNGGFSLQRLLWTKKNKTVNECKNSRPRECFMFFYILFPCYFPSMLSSMLSVNILVLITLFSVAVTTRSFPSLIWCLRRQQPVIVQLFRILHLEISQSLKIFPNSLSCTGIVRLTTFSVSQKFIQFLSCFRLPGCKRSHHAAVVGCHRHDPLPPPKKEKKNQQNKEVCWQAPLFVENACEKKKQPNNKFT